MTESTDQREQVARIILDFRFAAYASYTTGHALLTDDVNRLANLIAEALSLPHGEGEAVAEVHSGELRWLEPDDDKRPNNCRLYALPPRAGVMSSILSASPAEAGSDDQAARVDASKGRPS